MFPLLHSTKLNRRNTIPNNYTKEDPFDNTLELSVSRSLCNIYHDIFLCFADLLMYSRQRGGGVYQ